IRGSISARLPTSGWTNGGIKQVRFRKSSTHRRSTCVRRVATTALLTRRVLSKRSKKLAHTLKCKTSGRLRRQLKLQPKLKDQKSSVRKLHSAHENASRYICGI